MERSERLGLLPESVTLKHLIRTVLMGAEPPARAALGAAAEPLPDDRVIPTGPVVELLSEAMSRPEKKTATDAWLAPRLHAALRITRREAADPRLWNFMSMLVAPDYVIWRWLPEAKGDKTPVVNQRRFCGPFHVQAFARLWWAAELFRDGPDYRPVRIACGNQDVLNTVLRLTMIHHRPTAQAIVSMLREGRVVNGREVNALAKAVNTAGSTLFYELLGPDAETDPLALQQWISEADGAVIPYEYLPDGPPDGRVPVASTDALTALFDKLFAEAPVRGRKSEDGPAES